MGKPWLRRKRHTSGFEQARSFWRHGARPPCAPRQQPSRAVRRLTHRRFAEVEGYELTAGFVEAETGKGADALDRRPQLAAALAAGKGSKCPVIVRSSSPSSTGRGYRRPAPRRRSRRGRPPPHSGRRPKHRRRGSRSGTKGSDRRGRSVRRQCAGNHRVPTRIRRPGPVRAGGCTQQSRRQNRMWWAMASFERQEPPRSIARLEACPFLGGNYWRLNHRGHDGAQARQWPRWLPSSAQPHSEPPSMLIDSPVIQFELSETRNMMASTTSATVPTRPSGKEAPPRCTTSSGDEP